VLICDSQRLEVGVGSVHRLEKPSEPGFELGAAVEEFLAGLDRIITGWIF